MKPQVFYPAKSLDKAAVGHYSVELRLLGRLEDEAEHWYVEVQRLYTRVSSAVFDNIDRARFAFDEAKEGTIIAIGCEAFNLTVPPIVMLQSRL